MDLSFTQYVNLLVAQLILQVGIDSDQHFMTVLLLNNILNKFLFLSLNLDLIFSNFPLININ